MEVRTSIAETIEFHIEALHEVEYPVPIPSVGKFAVDPEVKTKISKAELGVEKRLDQILLRRKNARQVC